MKDTWDHGEPLGSCTAYLDCIR